MRIKVKDITNGFLSLKKLCDEKLPIKTSYRLARLLKTIQQENETFEAERIKLLLEYGEPSDDEPDIVRVPNDRIDEVNGMLNELLDQEIHIDCEKVDLSSQDIDIPANDLMNLLNFIIIDDDE